MDIYEEIVALRKAGRRAALATITNVRGSIPSFRYRQNAGARRWFGSGHDRRRLRRSRSLAGGPGSDGRGKTPFLTFDLNNDPSYNTGLVCGGTLEVFVEPVIPPAELFIFGGGHIALSVCKVAHLAGFEVTVIDDRENFANRERFPEAGQVIAADFEAAISHVAAFGIELSGHCHPWTPRRHASVGLGRQDRRALCRHDWLAAQGAHRLR